MLKPDPKTLRGDVVTVVLDVMPIPDDSTSWEQILEFRQDKDSRSKLIALRRWMRGVAKDSRSSTEIAEELEYLLHQYEGHMRLHRMKINAGTLESIATATGDIPHELLKLKLSSLVKPLCILGTRRVQLLEAELSCPGQEVAYVSKARRAFL
jgi:hypothetical protein